MTFTLVKVPQDLSKVHPQSLLNLKYNAYFSPNHRLLYVATPKVACTSFKWLFAELLGVRGAIEHATKSKESDPELVIHDSFFHVASEFTGVNEAGLLEAVFSPNYFRFCLVRNPFARIFSAWQSKWLLREPLQAHFYPKILEETLIESVKDIRSSFERFLHYLVNLDGDSVWDAHVAPQVSLLDPEHINYQMIAHIEDTANLVQTLAKQVGPGVRDPLSARRANVSVLPYSATWISVESAELIRSIYARDFEVFGYDTAVPTGAAALSDEALAIALRSIKLIRGRNARIGELIERLSVAPISGEAIPLQIPGLSRDLESVAKMLKLALDRRDKTIAEHSIKFAAMRDELLRAEAQLDLLKDVMLGSREEDRL